MNERKNERKKERKRKERFDCKNQNIKKNFFCHLKIFFLVYNCAQLKYNFVQYCPTLLNTSNIS